jgi:hypothetical protein
LWLRAVSFHTPFFHSYKHSHHLAKLCGASYINESYSELLHRRLDGEHYLNKNGKTIASIIEALVIEFENNDKRKIDTSKEKFGIERVFIHDLKKDESKRLHQNRLGLSR